MPPDARFPTQGRGDTHSRSDGAGEGGSAGQTTTRGGHETVVPEYDEFLELSSRTYVGFDEQMAIWARDVRNLPTGVSLLRLVDDPRLYRVHVKRSTPGHLKFDMETLVRHFPKALDDFDRLVEENFQQDFFTPASEIDRQMEERIQNVLRHRIVLPSSGSVLANPEARPTGPVNPFA